MVGFGYDNNYDCNNGATEFLKWGGSVILVSNFLPFLSSLVLSSLVLISLAVGSLLALLSFMDDKIRSLCFIKRVLALATVVVTLWVC